VPLEHNRGDTVVRQEKRQHGSDDAAAGDNNRRNFTKSVLWHKVS
jgi:hypothetical protein